MSAVLNTRAPAETAELDLVALGGRIGADVRGVRLSGELDRATSRSGTTVRPGTTRSTTMATSTAWCAA